MDSSSFPSPFQQFVMGNPGEPIFRNESISYQVEKPPATTANRIVTETLQFRFFEGFKILLNFRPFHLWIVRGLLNEVKPSILF